MLTHCQNNSYPRRSASPPLWFCSTDTVPSGIIFDDVDEESGPLRHIRPSHGYKAGPVHDDALTRYKMHEDLMRPSDRRATLRNCPVSNRLLYQAVSLFRSLLFLAFIPWLVELAIFKVANDPVHSYVEILESRLERMERLMNKVRPRTRLTRILLNRTIL